MEVSNIIINITQNIEQPINTPSKQNEIREVNVKNESVEPTKSTIVNEII